VCADGAVGNGAAADGPPPASRIRGPHRSPIYERARDGNKASAACGVQPLAQGGESWPGTTFDDSGVAEAAFKSAHGGHEESMKGAVGGTVERTFRESNAVGRAGQGAEQEEQRSDRSLEFGDA
jgi:hypothetical protein